MDLAGRLTFTPAADVFGNVSCTVTLAEMMPGGLSVSAPLLFVVTPGETCSIVAVLYIKPRCIQCDLNSA
jgi:hypothetical protein